MTSLQNLHDAVVFYCWWMLFYGLGPMIWFYPLNELDITGYEIFAAVWLIPFVLFIPTIRRLIEHPLSFLSLEISMVIGILSFQMPTTLSRLMVLSFGNAGGMLYFCVMLFGRGMEEGRRKEKFWMFIVANLLFLSSRVLTTSLVPAWSSYRMNAVVATIFAASVMGNFMISGGWSGKDVMAKKETGLETEERETGGLKDSPTTSLNKKNPKTASDSASLSPFQQFLIGLSLGSALYATHWLFGDLNVLSRWSVTGYPNPGPGTFSALLVLLALISGLYLPKSITLSIIFWIFGTSAFLLTYFLDNWPGFLSGLLFAVFLTAIWTKIGERLILCTNPALVVGSAMIVYLMEIFFHVWTVAFNFVPGGVYTREHSDYLIVFINLTFLPLFSIRKEIQIAKIGHRFVIFAVLIAAGGLLMRAPLQPMEKRELNAETRDFTALIWTFHFGYDNRGWPSLERAADVLSRTGADVIALLESDASKPYLGHNDLAMWLSERLGMFVDFGPSTKDHTWGNLLLSKYPIVASTHHLLPSPHGELAPAISATLNMSGHLVDIVTTHMGNDRDILDRKLQTEYLSRIASSSPRPLVFLGYVTSAPGSRDYKHYTTAGMLRDIDPGDEHRWCEYIMYRRLIRQAYARISHGGLSDTELQMARFSIPKDVNKFVENDLTTTDLKRVHDDDKWKLFTGDYFGDFFQGHFSGNTHHYHMSTPKYFMRKKS